MRNRALYGALRDFALETAALLTDDLREGAEVEFDVIDQAGRRGPALYQYKPRTEAFLAERWSRLRELDTCVRAAEELGSGAALWLRVTGGGAARAVDDLVGLTHEGVERVHRQPHVSR